MFVWGNCKMKYVKTNFMSKLFFQKSNLLLRENTHISAELLIFQHSADSFSKFYLLDGGTPVNYYNMGTFNCLCKVLWCSTEEPMVDCKHHPPCNVLLHMFIVVYIHIVCCSCFHRQLLYPPYCAIVTSSYQCDVHVVSTYKSTTTATLLFSSVKLVKSM